MDNASQRTRPPHPNRSQAGPSQNKSGAPEGTPADLVILRELRQLRSEVKELRSRNIGLDQNFRVFVDDTKKNIANMFRVASTRQEIAHEIQLLNFDHVDLRNNLRVLLKVIDDDEDLLKRTTDQDHLEEIQARMTTNKALLARPEQRIVEVEARIEYLTADIRTARFETIDTLGDLRTSLTRTRPGSDS